MRTERREHGWPREEVARDGVGVQRRHVVRLEERVDEELPVRLPLGLPHVEAAIFSEGERIELIGHVTELIVRYNGFVARRAQEHEAVRFGHGPGQQRVTAVVERLESTGGVRSRGHRAVEVVYPAVESAMEGPRQVSDAGLDQW